MARLIDCDNGWVICSEKYFNSIYCSIRKENSVDRTLMIKKEFFDIKTPFLTNGMSEKYGKILQSKETYVMKKTKKRKKKTFLKNQLDDSKIISFIQESIGNMIDAGRSSKVFEYPEITSGEWFENNGKARKAATEVLHHINPSLDVNSELHFENSSDIPIIQKFGGEEYVVPSKCRFHLCDITSFVNTTDEKFDVILIDPPWINKSVKRKKSYSSVKYEFLQSLEFEKLANPGCLIAVWITNSSSAASFVLEDLFPKCNVILSSMWHWCKVTKKGSFVYPLDSHHKKPYENLILGRVQYDSDEVEKRPSKEIGPKKLIVSVPSSIHSCKPPLVDILKPYLNDNPHCLELFARYLLPGWTSVGNEVLKLQNIRLLYN